MVDIDNLPPPYPVIIVVFRADRHRSRTRCLPHRKRPNGEVYHRNHRSVHATVHFVGSQQSVIIDCERAWKLTTDRVQRLTL